MEDQSVISMPDGLILAAGYSSRMGKLKSLLLWHGEPLLMHVIRKLLLVCGKIVIVTGFEADLIKDSITPLVDIESSNRIEFVHNYEYDKGMYSSLKTGIKYLLNSDWVLYHFTDQPGLPDAFYYQFKEQIDSKFNWIQPGYNQKNGHPILIHNQLFPQISEKNEYSSLKEISRLPVLKKKIWECQYSAILQDIDTIEEWNKFINS